MTLTPRRAAGLAALAALAVALPSVGSDFVIDDTYHILRNPLVRDLGNVHHFFTGPWGTGSRDPRAGAINTRYYRPMAMTVSALEYALFGDQPFGYHLVSALLHALCAALASLLVAQIARSALAALLGGLLFALHPVQAEAIAAVSYQTTILAGVFGAAALLSFGRILEKGPRAGRLLLLALAVAAGCLSKEDAFAVPLCAVAWAVLLRPPGWRRALAWSGIAMAVAAGGVLLARAAVVVPSPLTYFGSAPPGTVALTMLRVGALYGELLLVPFRLCPFYDWFIVPFEEGVSGGVVLGATLLVAAIAGIGFSARRKSPVAVGLAWLLLGLLPVSQIIPIIVVAAERFLYLPMLGVSLFAGHLTGCALAWARGRGPLAARTVGVAAAVVLAAYGARTAVRLLDWRDDGTLNRATAASFAESPTPLLNLADFHQRRGEVAQARAALEEAVRRAPRGWDLPRRKLEKLRAQHPELR